MIRTPMLALVAVLGAIAAPAPGQAPGDEPREIRTRQDVLEVLNTHSSMVAREKSYEVLFDAYLRLTPPAFEMGELFNQTTIHPGMPEWPEVRAWAEAGSGMADAIEEAKSKLVFGLPYGEHLVPARYREAGLVAAIGRDGSLRNSSFGYLAAIDVIGAFATAEAYRRFEAGQPEAALDLYTSYLFVLRQLSDRQFVAEKSEAIQLLTEALSNLRDMLYVHLDDIPVEKLDWLGYYEVPYLRPDRNSLELPEGDRIVSEALIHEVFAGSDQADPDRFREVFARIQSADRPLVRFGAARRWTEIAALHSSRDDSLARLRLIYDDWFRRWRVQEYDPILDVKTEFERTNPVRYAAVIYSMQDIEFVFQVRNTLIAAVNGTAMSAGLCAHKKTYGDYPPHIESIYYQFVRKRSDTDPFDKQFDKFKYRLVDEREHIDTSAGRVWVEPGDCLLYSRARDHEDDRAREHADDATGDGDLVLWPPIRVLQRQEGYLR